MNPKFAKAIITTFKFEEQQRLRFVVIDVDKENGKISDQDLIGTLISFQIFCFYKNIFAFFFLNLYCLRDITDGHIIGASPITNKTTRVIYLEFPTISQTDQSTGEQWLVKTLERLLFSQRK